MNERAGQRLLTPLQQAHCSGPPPPPLLLLLLKRQAARKQHQPQMWEEQLQMLAAWALPQQQASWEGPHQQAREQRLTELLLQQQQRGSQQKWDDRERNQQRAETNSFVEQVSGIRCAGRIHSEMHADMSRSCFDWCLHGAIWSLCLILSLSSLSLPQLRLPAAAFTPAAQTGRPPEPA